VAGALRVLAWRSVPLAATEIAGVERPWLAYVLPGLGLLTLLVLYRLLRERLDLPTAIVACALWAVAGWAVIPPAGTWPEQIAVLGLLGTTASAMGIAERRQPAGSWRLGVWLALTSIFSGIAWIWGVVLLAWLPAVSRRLRGMGAARLVGEVAGAWILVFALGTALVQVSPVTWRILPDGDRVLAGLRDDTLAAPFTRHDSASQAALDAWVGFEMAEADLREADSGIEREAAVQTLIWKRLVAHPWRHLRTSGRRLRAAVSGWPGLGSPALTVPVLPWSVLALAAWLGVLALAASWRRYLPLLLGVAAPLLQMAVCGITVASLVLALPFLATLAGYGLQRLAVGRASIWTWLLGGAVLAVAWASHHAVAAWS
jgi:hypothetical protein